MNIFIVGITKRMEQGREKITVQVFQQGFPQTQMTIQEVQNFVNHIDDQLNNFPEGAPRPRIIIITLENEPMKIYCFGDNSLFFIVDAINRWRGPQMDIVLADAMQNFLFSAVIPGNGLDEGRVLIKLNRCNNGLSTSRWRVLGTRHAPIGTEFTFEIDPVSFADIERIGFVLNFDGQAIQMHRI